MQSPFASVALDADIIDAFQPIDENRAKINKYFRLHMRYRVNIDRAGSCPAHPKEITKRQKNLRHLDRVGLLMVNSKRPFRVRFSGVPDLAEDEASLPKEKKGYRSPPHPSLSTPS